MIFKENLTEILDGIRPFLLPLNSYSFYANYQKLLIPLDNLVYPKHELLQEHCDDCHLQLLKQYYPYYPLLSISLIYFCTKDSLEKRVSAISLLLCPHAQRSSFGISIICFNPLYILSTSVGLKKRPFLFS